MSYDLAIRSDESYSEYADLKEVKAFIKRLPHIVPNGKRGFCFRDGEHYYMEIDLEIVSEEGDSIEDEEDSPKDEVNCIVAQTLMLSWTRTKWILRGTLKYASESQSILDGRFMIRKKMSISMSHQQTKPGTGVDITRKGV